MNYYNIWSHALSRRCGLSKAICIRMHIHADAACSCLGHRSCTLLHSIIYACTCVHLWEKVISRTVHFFIHIHYDMQVDIDEVVDRYAHLHPPRVELYSLIKP